jgi:hypothetical protein
LNAEPRSTSAAAYLAGLLILAMAFVPLLTIELPPLVDYPNHLARQHILAQLPNVALLAKFYVSEWSATPYLAMDGIVQALAHAMSVAAAAKVFLALMLFLLALAPFALNLALFGRITLAPLFGLLFVHNATVSLGFVPYVFSLGYGLCLLALWIRFRDGTLWMRLLVIPALATSLFFCHLIGFVIYGLTVAAYELGRHFESTGPERRRKFFLLDRAQRINLGSLVLQCALPLLVFLTLGPASETEDVVRQTTHGGLGRKFELLAGMALYLMPPYVWSIDRALAIALPVGLVVLLATKKLVYSKHMLMPLGALVALYFAMPMQWLGGWGGDHRLLPAIALLVAGSLRPAVREWRGWWLVLPLVVGLLLVRTAAVTMEWRAADREAAAFIKSFSTIAAGSKVYYAFGHEGGRNSWLRPKYYLPCLAVTDRHVFVPYLFTSDVIRGIPLRYRPEFASLQRLSSGPILTNRASPNWGAIVDAYDYFVIGNEKYFDTPVPAQLVPVYMGEGFKIYKR